MKSIRFNNKQLVLFAGLCLIIFMSAVIINKFDNTADGAAAIAENPSEQTAQGDGTESAPDRQQTALSDIDRNSDLLILVNKQNELDPGYKPDDLERIEAFAPGRDDSARYMRCEAAEHLDAMFSDALKQDMEIVITTAYRSYALQKAIFDSNVIKKGSVEAANRTSAKPGQSEHQTGLAADLSTASLDYAISYEFGESKEGKWIKEHAWEYGFILRYPEGREDITGYSYEPWHIRYVGETAAEYITRNELTLEELIVELNR